MHKKNAKNRKKKQLFYVILRFLWTFAQLCERYFGGNPPRRGRGVPKYCICLFQVLRKDKLLIFNQLRIEYFYQVL